MLTLLVVVASLALLALMLAGALGVALMRLAANAGPLDLEDYARRNHVVFIPVAAELAKSLTEPSKAVRIQLDQHRHPLLATLSIIPLDGEALSEI